MVCQAGEEWARASAPARDTSAGPRAGFSRFSFSVLDYIERLYRTKFDNMTIT
jgi:hypothetical protein